MNNIEYVLANSLPFDIDVNDPDAQTLLNQLEWPRQLAEATTHQEDIEALDTVVDWVKDHWREVLPHIAKNFPVR